MPWLVDEIALHKIDPRLDGQSELCSVRDLLTDNQRRARLHGGNQRDDFFFMRLAGPLRTIRKSPCLIAFLAISK